MLGLFPSKGMIETQIHTRTVSLNFQEIIFALNQYWASNGCVIMQPYDMEVGAGTFHPATFLAAIGPEPSRSAYVQPSRRPTDGRYGENPNRLQHYFQYQVVLKPSPMDFQDLYLGSIQQLGIDPRQDDIRFVEDDWESPTLGAWGLGWEVWLNGMEITQFTYFQQVGGLECRPITGEITYGLERIAMYVQGVDNVFDLDWNGEWSYGDIYAQNEFEQSTYNFEYADTKALLKRFDAAESQCNRLTQEVRLPLPAYEQVLQASHTFNLLDARRVIGVTERARYIGRVRNMARQVANAYYDIRSDKGFPRLRSRSSNSAVEEVQTVSETRPVAQAVADDPPCAPLLLEIGTEELPPKSIERIETALRTELVEELFKAGLIESKDASIRQTGLATPRRIAIIIGDVKRKTSDTETVRRGPALDRAFNAEGAPTPAAIGFAKSCGVDVEDLDRIETEKGIFVAHRTTQHGQGANELIPQCVEQAVSRLPIPKRMRWGDGDAQFIRPVHWLVLLHGKHVVPCRILSVDAGASSKGHRFHCAEDFQIDEAANYSSIMQEKGSVITSRDERRRVIKAQMSELQELVGGEVNFRELDDFNAESLLDEVVDLVEYPSVFLGQFDQRFLSLPKEVLVASMHVHQRFFPLWKNSELVPWFVGVANISLDDPDVRKRVASGNERVLTARLSDADFFWEQDRKYRSQDRVENLRGVVFHKSLGSLFDKTARIRQLAGAICGMLDAEPEFADRAAQLSKSDLVSEMVGEFPSLQGIMGCCYAIADGESEEVATAVREHYYPRSGNDPKLPQSVTGQIVALADRIDSLVGLIAAGERVRGDRDPYGLRRMAIGIVRLLIECGFDLDVEHLLHESAQIYSACGPDDSLKTGKFEDAVNAALTLIYDRLHFYYVAGGGYDADEFAAVDALKPRRLADFDKRLNAVRTFKQLPECDNLVAANKRIRNILRKSEQQANGAVDAGLLTEQAESRLHDEAIRVRTRIDTLIEDSEHSIVLQELAVLKEPIDQFFDDVMVLDEDPEIRANRMNLVGYIHSLFLEVADISMLKSSQDSP